MYIRNKDPFRVGTNVEIALPLKNDEMMSLEGTVIYVKGVGGDMFKIAPGMAIEFKNLNDNAASVLRSYITGLLTSDILEEQDEPVIRTDY
jgi:Tfp pilus assembly protein PilZ